jgi:tripartite-type tricarboxylate transporter receptor subunit TctC
MKRNRIALTAPTALIAALAFSGLAALHSAAASAQAWPSKPMRVIIPFAAGGSTDIVGRLIAERFGQGLGQPIVAENRTGAGGIIGSDVVAKAPGDGYTLLLAIAATHAIQPALGIKLPYDAVKDFAPIGQVGIGAIAIAVAEGSSYRNVNDLINDAKARNLTYGTGGIASGGHLVGEALVSLTGAKLTHVPYKGGAPAMNDLMGGQIASVLTDTATTAGYVKNGKVRVIGVAGPKRSPAFPDLPNLVEQGIAFDAGSWFGLFTSPGTPAPIIQRLNAEMNRMLAMPDIKDRWESMGLSLGGGSADDFAKIQARDIAMWTKIVRNANIKVEQQ